MSICDGKCCKEAEEYLVYDVDLDAWILVVGCDAVVVYYCPYCGKRLEKW